MNYAIDQDWETSWIPFVIKKIKPELILEKAPIKEDKERVSDIMPSVLVRKIRIGVRVRRPQYHNRYPYDITFRAHRNSGAKTEFEKIVTEGWGDLMFYGHASTCFEQFRSFRRWTLVSLHAVRRIMQTHPPLRMIPNGDGTFFHAIDIKKWHLLDDKFVIDSNWNDELNPNPK